VERVKPHFVLFGFEKREYAVQEYWGRLLCVCFASNCMLRYIIQLSCHTQCIHITLVIKFRTPHADMVLLDLKLSRAHKRPGSIPVYPEPPLVFSHDLLGRSRSGLLVVSPLRIACVFLHCERGRSSQRVWRRHRINHFISPSESLQRTKALSTAMAYRDGKRRTLE
jgi:hypothetical protein